MLSDQQEDALVEIVNTAAERTAASLSQLTGEQVLLDVRRAGVYPLAELIPTLAAAMRDEVAMVHQIFSGSVAGDALLLLDYEAAVALVERLTHEPEASHRLSGSAREVLVEVGSILLNACLGVLGELLQVRMTLSAPRLHLDDLSGLLQPIAIEQPDRRRGLVVRTSFRLGGQVVGAYLVIVLGLASLDHLIQAIERTA